MSHRGALSFDSRLLERFSAVVESIYASALDPNLWSTSVRAIAELHECPKADLVTPALAPADGGLIFSYGLDEAGIQLWATKYISEDVWVRAAVRKGPIVAGVVVFGADLVTDDELMQSVFYQEFLKPEDMRYFCGAAIFDGSSPPAPLTSMSLFRGHRDTPFTEHNRELQRLLIPHISRALGVMFRLRNAELQLAANLAALNRVACGVVLFGERGNVVFANSAAEAIFRRNDGLQLRHGNPLTDQSGWLAATHSGDDALLRSEIATAVSPASVAVSHFNTGVLLRRVSASNPLVLQLSALAPDNAFSHGERLAAAIGFIMDPDSVMHLDRQLLARAYGLTTAECALAEVLLSGDPVKQVSARLGISQNTVKTQLQSIFEKTATQRQAQLVKLLVSFAAPRT